MTLDIALTIPVTPLQIMEGVLLIVILVGLVSMIMIKNIGGTLLFLFMALTYILMVVIIPLICITTPHLPPAFQPVVYTTIHPETWFNITVVWGGA